MSGIIQNLFLLQSTLGAELQSKINNLEFFKDEDELDRTIDNDECQNWNSHEVHDETSWFNIFDYKYDYPKNGKIWGSMFRQDKNLIRDGLLKAQRIAGDGSYRINNNTGVVINEESESTAKSGNQGMNNIRLNSNTAGDIEEIVKTKESEGNTFEKSGKGDISSKIRWISHNKCRNPGNYMGAPWCYTKNPNVRWQYCTQPDYSQIIARSVLLITFLFCFILAYLAVKAIFKGELFSLFIAKLTGQTVSGSSKT